LNSLELLPIPNIDRFISTIYLYKYVRVYKNKGWRTELITKSSTLLWIGLRGTNPVRCWSSWLCLQRAYHGRVHSV